MTLDTVRIAQKAKQAANYLESTKTLAAALVNNPATTGEDWGKFALKIAEAEGAAVAWARLVNVVNHNESHAIPVTEADVLSLAFDLLSNGANDSWSGRGNDIKRARFDGMISAANDMKWV